MNIIQLNSPHQNQGRRGWTPDMIVCHITQGTFNGTLAWTSNPTSQVSYHFVVAQDGRIAQLVPIENTAWANGTTTTQGNRSNSLSTIPMVRERDVNANLYTISIGHEGILSETNGALTPAQTKATTNLIAHIRNEVKRIYNKEIPLNRQHIVAHADITPRWKPNCPGNNFPFNQIINNLKEMTEMRFQSILDMPQDLQPEMRRLIEENHIRGTGRTLPNGEQELNILETVALSAIVASRIVDGRMGQ